MCSSSGRQVPSHCFSPSPHSWSARIPGRWLRSGRAAIRGRQLAASTSGRCASTSHSESGIAIQASGAAWRSQPADIPADARPGPATLIWGIVGSPTIYQKGTSYLPIASSLEGCVGLQPRLSRQRDGRQDENEVDGGRGDHKDVEHLVVAKDLRPQLRTFQRIHHRARAVRAHLRSPARSTHWYGCDRRARAGRIRPSIRRPGTAPRSPSVGSGTPVVATITPLPASTQMTTSNTIDGQPWRTFTTTGVYVPAMARKMVAWSRRPQTRRVCGDHGPAVVARADREEQHEAEAIDREGDLAGYVAAADDDQYDCTGDRGRHGGEMSPAAQHGTRWSRIRGDRRCQAAGAISSHSGSGG